MESGKLVDRSLRAKLKRESRDKQLNDRNKIFDSMNLDLRQLKNKESIWCLTETGPFKNHLFKMNLIGINDEICRFCNMERETAEHLLFKCSYFDRFIDFKDRYNFKDVCDFENRILVIFKELRRFTI